ncbi:MAG: sigma-70 family RNA polymerase sigma factor [Planctomycetes bacterium]|nr:sigma-70 family RNA polymerase sigma factor [Planctomycetota bacterium]
MRNDPLVNASPDESAKLVSDIRKGSQDAFSQLVRQYQAKVRCYLGRFVRGADVVEDLAQETFIAAYRSLPGYKQQSSLALWLLGIARNLALKHLRDEQRRRSHETESLEAAISRWTEERLDGDEAGVDRHEEVVAALRTCMDGLQKHSAGMIRDAYFRGRTAAEIAQESGKTEGAVWVTMMRIRQTLRECIGAQIARAESP